MKKFLAVLFSVVILATFMAVPAFAAVSPEGEVVHTVELPSGDTVEVADGDTITLEKEDNGYEFTGWVIEGEYEIVSGDLTSDNLVIRPLSDLVVEATYDSGDENLEDDDVEVDENESDKAPQTGNGTIVLVTLLTAGAFVAMVATRKAVRS